MKPARPTWRANLAKAGSGVASTIWVKNITIAAIFFRFLWRAHAQPAPPPGQGTHTYCRSIDAWFGAIMCLLRVSSISHLRGGLIPKTPNFVAWSKNVHYKCFLHYLNIRTTYNRARTAQTQWRSQKHWNKSHLRESLPLKLPRIVSNRISQPKEKHIQTFTLFKTRRKVQWTWITGQNDEVISGLERPPVTENRMTRQNLLRSIVAWTHGNSRQLLPLTRCPVRMNVIPCHDEVS